MKKKMLKLTSLIAAFAITMVSLPASVGAMSSYGENLIQNPGFDNDTTNWEQGSVSNPFTVTTVDGNKVALSEDRANNTDGPKQKITLKENTSYVVSVRIKPVSTTDQARGKLRFTGDTVDGKDKLGLSMINCPAGQWTQFTGVIDSGNLANVTDIYVWFQTSTNKNTTNNTYTGNSAFYLDDFEVKEYITTPEVPVAGNLISNAGFETGQKPPFVQSEGTINVVKDEFKANTGNYAVLSTDRTKNYSGAHTNQIALSPATYYYVRAMVMAGSATSAKARMRLQQGSNMTTITSANGTADKQLSNTEYTRVANVFRNEDATTGKVYVLTTETDSFVDLYTDDYVLLPITSSVADGATDVEPNAAITLTVPEDIEVSKETLSITNGATITNVARTGRECVVSISGMDYSNEYTLKLKTGLNDNCYPTYTFTTAAKPADYETSFSRSGTTINCSFTNNVNDDKIMLAVAGYSDSGQLKYIEIDVSETTSETLTVTAPDDGVCDTVKVLLWNMKTLAPVCGALSLDDITDEAK